MKSIRRRFHVPSLRDSEQIFTGADLELNPERYRMPSLRDSSFSELPRVKRFQIENSAAIARLPEYRRDKFTGFVEFDFRQPGRDVHWADKTSSIRMNPEKVGQQSLYVVLTTEFDRLAVRCE